ncbi:MAG: glycoside hydrolase family 28 protein [Selenomonadaceae bacterium]|nr:glycoside hydrolase family 28 protein [Selenomonadaceae bacterium]
MFAWNQERYDEILTRIHAMPLPAGAMVFRIDAEKYRSLVEEVEEIYYEHPEGPYKGSKAQLKQDEAYRKQKLVEKRRNVAFYGKAIQAAIDEAAAAGGGRVEIPVGNWCTGALELKSNVELHLSVGAKLSFIRNKSNAFYPLRLSRWEGVECMNFSPFLYANGVENISVTGEGTLDGMADEFNWMPWKFGYFGETDQEIQRQRLFQAGEDGIPVEERIFDDTISTLRPPFIQFYHSRNIRIEGVRIENSPFWEINPVLCENVWIRGIHIETDLYNNDGIDPESAKDVLIEDCFFLTGDDCIAIKSGRNGDGRRIGVPTENVIIRNNKFANGHGGVTIGSEISGGVHDVFAIGNHFDSPNLDYPIRFKTNAMRGGNLENVYVKDSVVNKARLAVVHADFFYEEGHEGDFLPRLANITIDGFQTAKGGSIDAKYAFYLKGFEDAPIENVTFKDMELEGVKGDAVLANIRSLAYENVSINGKKQADQKVDIGAEGQVTSRA